MAQLGSSTVLGSMAITGNTKVGGMLTLGQNLVIGTGGVYQAGSIYSDASWGMIFRAKQVSPINAIFLWTDSADVHLMQFAGGTLTTYPVAGASAINVGSGATAPYVQLNGGSFIQENYPSANLFILYARNSYDLVMYTGNSQRIRITNAGAVGLGSLASPFGRFHINGNSVASVDAQQGIYSDGADRPGIGLSGDYPVVQLMSGVVNANHGAALSLGGKNSGDTNFQKFVIGTPGSNVTFMDFAWSSSTNLAGANPHVGLRNYSNAGNTAKVVMTLLSSGNTLFGDSTVLTAPVDNGDRVQILGNFSFGPTSGKVQVQYNSTEASIDFIIN